MDEIGDLVTVLPVFYNIHNQYPNARITLLCKPFNAIFFQNLDYIDCVHSLDEVLQKDYYDLILDLRGNKKTLQYAFTHRPKYRLDRGSIRLKNKFFGGQKNEIDTNLEVISPIINGELKNSNTICLSTVEINKINTFIDLEGLNQFAIIHIGARDKARRWPIDRFQVL